MSKMKFKEGDTVEVSKVDHGSLQSWCRARIISSGRHSNKVQYESIPNANGKSLLQDVHAGAVRPEPPVLTETKRLVVGDMVETYDNHSWKRGQIVKTLSGRLFVVKLMETLQQKRCYQSCVRPLLLWQHDKWLHVNKADRDCLLETVFQLPKESHIVFQFQDRSARVNVGKRKHGRDEATFAPHKPLKRNAGSRMQSACDCQFLKTEIAPHKRRAIQRFGHQGAVPESSIPVLEKVETFPFPRKHMGEEYVCSSSFEDRIYRSVDEAGSDQCSVASSSSSCVSNYKLNSYIKHSNRPVVGSPFDDAQSSCECPQGRKIKPLTEKDVAAKVHKLELRAYRKTIRAFHASGCLTWEREALLTDLRLSLHISEYEHLYELAHLCQA